ncbi:MAG TPA: biosynthetic-type acetolactate synthase large subunit [Bacillota bacterium]|jgi:acetolactate synthase-1/2/3 large subunit
MKVTGAQALFKSLLEEDVEVIFGYPGGQVLEIYDALPQFPIRHILTRHEQGAVHAADGFARATGKVGVCLATSGPGAANLVTGLATAYMDSTPLVALTGQVSTALLGRDAFQESDLTGITMPITKHNYLVKDPADLPRIIKEAFHIASTGRPGPVLVDIPRDVQMGKVTFRYPSEVSLPGYKPTFYGHPAQITQAAKALGAAERPLILAGGGVTSSGAHEILMDLAEKLSIPVVSTLLGLGTIPADHPLFLGMLGMHGTYRANRAVHEADLLLAVGTRFSDRVTGPTDQFAAKAKIIHVDVDPAEIGKNVQVDIPVVGDARQILEVLTDKVGETKPDVAEWLAEIRSWHADGQSEVDDESPVNPPAAIRWIAEAAGQEAVIVTDVGQHQMWTAQHWPVRRPHTLISSGGLGTMGFGLPAAIGAKVGRPDAPVVLITGDGSFQMNVQELGTMAAEGIALKIFLFNNGSLGMVRQWQDLFLNGRLSQINLRGWPDFIRLVEAYGLKASRVERHGQLKSVLKTAMGTPEAHFVECQIDPDEKVFPMVPPGKSTMEMILGPG